VVDPTGHASSQEVHRRFTGSYREGIIRHGTQLMQNNWGPAGPWELDVDAAVTIILTNLGNVFLSNVCTPQEITSGRPHRLAAIADSILMHTTAAGVWSILDSEGVKFDVTLATHKACFFHFSANLEDGPQLVCKGQEMFREMGDGKREQPGISSVRSFLCAARATCTSGDGNILSHSARSGSLIYKLVSLWERTPPNETRTSKGIRSFMERLFNR
jgi:hypothetical protein